MPYSVHEPELVSILMKKKKKSAPVCKDSEMIGGKRRGQELLPETILQGWEGLFKAQGERVGGHSGRASLKLAASGEQVGLAKGAAAGTIRQRPLHLDYTWGSPGATQLHGTVTT